MVIGRGLLAKTFSHFAHDDTVCIFASGVSNSQEIDETAYSRERELLYTIPDNCQLIYFSTISCYDKSLIGSRYLRHKYEMEIRISENVSRYKIFRLPNLVGHSDNPNTLTNFIRDRIEKEEPLKIFKHASRYLMDADDVGALVTRIIKTNEENLLIDANFNNSINVLQLVELIESTLGKQTKHELIDKGSDYETNNHLFLELTREILPQHRDQYNQRLIEKYYGVKA